MARTILCLNAGSSSLKFALFTSEGHDEPAPLAHGKIEGIEAEPHLTMHDAEGRKVREQPWRRRDGASGTALVDRLLDEVERHIGHDLVGVGHRVVHGGTRFSAPVRIDEEVLQALEALCPLAPLHQPHSLAAIRAVTALRASLPQVACFDTAFHHNQPAVAVRFALPRSFEQEGIRRYGFHGISYEYIAHRLAEIDPARVGGRVIAAHLGNGASLCAMASGRSVDTTMSFTALDGLVMGTRCGSIDPGVILHLLQQKGMTADEVQHLLYDCSGLLGVSGVSGDMRKLIASEDPHAREAIDLFTYRIARETGALVSSLGGLDEFIFTGGIGENAADIRTGACARLRWLGIDIDEDANRRGEAVISSRASRVTVRVIPTDEERMIAIHATDLLAGTTDGAGA